MVAIVRGAPFLLSGEGPPYILWSVEKGSLTLVVIARGSPIHWRSVGDGPPYIFISERDASSRWLSMGEPFIGGQWEKGPLTLWSMRSLLTFVVIGRGTAVHWGAVGEEPPYIMVNEMPPHIGGHWERDHLTVVVSGRWAPLHYGQ